MCSHSHDMYVCMIPCVAGLILIFCIEFAHLPVCAHVCVPVPDPCVSSLNVTLTAHSASTLARTSPPPFHPLQNVNPLYHQPETQHANPLFAGKTAPPEKVADEDDLPKKML